MNKIEKVYLSGLGAIGSMFAAKIHDMNSEMLKVVANQNRIEKYKEKGVLVNGTQYDFNYMTSYAEAAPADLIIFAVKQHHLPQAIKDIKKFVGPQTIFMSLLNGIESERILEEIFGEEKVLYAFCVGQDSVRNDTHINYHHIGRIVFGDRTNNPNSEAVLAIKALFEKSEIPYNIPENISKELWWKFMINVGVNQVSSVLKAPYGVFQNTKDAMDLVLMAAREVVLLSQKADIHLTEADLDKMVSTLHQLDPKGKTSMLQDMEAGRKTEVDIFAGSVIRLGQKYGVEVPVNQMLYKQIQVLEAMNLKQSL